MVSLFIHQFQLMLLCRLWNIVLCASWVAWSRFCFKGNQIKRIIASNIQRKLLKTNLDIIGCPNVDKWATHDALRTRFHTGQIAIQSNINSNICVKFGCYKMCSFWRYWIFYVWWHYELKLEWASKWHNCISNPTTRNI